VKQGVIIRDDRFGYVELATRGFRSPFIDQEVGGGTPTLTKARSVWPPLIGAITSDRRTGNLEKLTFKLGPVQLTSEDHQVILSQRGDR